MQEPLVEGVCLVATDYVRIFQIFSGALDNVVSTYMVSCFCISNLVCHLLFEIWVDIKTNKLIFTVQEDYFVHWWVGINNGNY